MPGPIVRSYGIPNYAEIFGKKPEEKSESEAPKSAADETSQAGSTPKVEPKPKDR